ncbi:hypothetical protein GYMLUDRAFT_50974, partial [Collybiopsis luxurians FD-317 M1]
FYTGNGTIARINAAVAAKHVTPLTLELGGKSLVIVDSKCDLELAAKRTITEYLLRFLPYILPLHSTLPD